MATSVNKLERREQAKQRDHEKCDYVELMETDHIISEGKAFWEKSAIANYADGELYRNQCYTHTTESILENEYNEIH